MSKHRYGKRQDEIRAARRVGMHQHGDDPEALAAERLRRIARAIARARKKHRG